jgi:tetratricopeptide (TPR) repeat protein
MLLRAYLALNRWDEAVAEGEKAVALGPKNAVYHTWLGRAYGEKAGHSNFVIAITNAKKLRAEFETAIALDPREVQVRADLAEFYMQAPGFIGGGKERARAQADELNNLGAHATAYWVLAKIAESNKEYSLAEKHFRSSVQVSQSAPEQLLNLASFFGRRGRLDELERTVQQAVQSAAGSPKHSLALYEAAELLFRSGRDLPGAVQLLRNYISSPEHSEEAPVFRAHYLLGQILETVGDRKGAAQQYRAALALASGFAPAQSALKKIE